VSDQLYTDLSEILLFDIAEFASNPDYVEFLKSVKARLDEEIGNSE
jgi:hypothetical protein